MSPNQGAVCAVAVVLSGVATIAIGCRYYARRIRHAKLGGDDWTALAALILTWGLSVILIIGTAKESFGTHTAINPKTGADVVTKKEQNASKFMYAFLLVMIMDFGLIKLSVLLLYRRVFVGKHFERFSLAMCVLIGLWSLSFFFATAFQCGTDAAAWWTSAKTIVQFCDHTAWIELGFAVSDVVTDLMVLAIPVPLVWKLHASTLQKLSLTFIFLLGLISTASATARLVFVSRDIYETATGYRDVIGVATNVVVWSQVEAGVAVIAACLPTLRPLFFSKGVQTLLNSIRSTFSLTSFTQRSPRRQGSDSEGLAGSGGTSYPMPSGPNTKYAESQTSVPSAPAQQPPLPQKPRGRDEMV